MPLPFSKLQAAGNCYVAVDGRGLSRDWPDTARRVAADRFGVGSDGLLVVEDSAVAPLRMRVWNSDGSESGMSGNGIRLFAKFVLDRGLASAGPDGLDLETGGGVRTVWPTFEQGRMVAGRVAMGEPRFHADAIPAAAVLADSEGTVREQPLQVGDRTLRVTCVSLGNPHAVAILDTDVDDFPLDEIGPGVERHAAFPGRINFEVVNVVDRGHLRVRVFERGEGETLSSGTGSTASGVVARLLGLTGDGVDVSLRGGTLHVDWPGAGEAYLAGPTHEILTGLWPESR